MTVDKSSIIKSPNFRWEFGIPHNKKSIALFERIQELDFKYNNDYFEWKSGGDGDNGEELMYLLDQYFEEFEALFEPLRFFGFVSCLLH